MYKEIKVVYIDVDGTLTDGNYHISESGEVTKSFYTRDFYAIERLLRDGLRVIIITQSHDRVIEQQLIRICSHSDFWSRQYGNNLLFRTEVEDKAERIEKTFKHGEMGWKNIAYIGDAENDFECIINAGVSGCPKDAIPAISDVAIVPTGQNGGHGAVHEFIMFLLEMRAEENK